MRVERLGEHALRFVVTEGVDRAAALRRLRAIPGVVDAVFAEATGAVVYEGAPPDEAAIGAALVIGIGAPGRERTVRVRYDGPDLARVAAWAGITEAEVIRRHAAPLYTVRFVGFLPGFAYLGDVDPSIAAPRLPAPRTRVPALSVGIAGDRTGVYPFASPGGWNLVGRAEGLAPLGSGDALAVGDRVRFEPI